jgi:hypothetical protein
LRAGRAVQSPSLERSERHIWGPAAFEKKIRLRYRQT